MMFPKLLIFLSQYIIFIRTSFLKDQLNAKIVKIGRFDGRLCGRKVPMDIYYSGVTSTTTTLYIANNTVHVKENLVSKPKMTFTIKKCISRENLDSCEDYHQMQNLDYCQNINPDAVLGPSPLGVPFQPKFKCPIKKGVYRAYNFTVSLTPFVLFKLDGFYWRIRLDILSPNDNRLLACINIEAYTALNSHA